MYGDINGIANGIVHRDVVSGVTMRSIADDKRALSQAIGYPESNLVFVKQVHGNVIHVVRSLPHVLPALPHEAQSLPHEAQSQGLVGDGMMTAERDIILCVRIADCAGVLLWDESTSTIAAVHSGWRGTHENIVGKCVGMMLQHFGGKPETMRAFISPCASGDQYEVREDVAQLFPDHVVRSVANRDVWHFDNRSAIRSQLEESGIEASRVCIDPSCTLVDGRFHSFRRDGSSAGRCVAFIGLRSFDTSVPL